MLTFCVIIRISADRATNTHLIHWTEIEITRSFTGCTSKLHARLRGLQYARDHGFSDLLTDQAGARWVVDAYQLHDQ